MSAPVIYIENCNPQYRELFFDMGWVVAKNPDDADVFCFTGGSDVSPYLYHDAQHPRTYCNPYRDEKEKRLFEYIQGRGLPSVGICRGGQFLNVMSGGRLFQHVSSHTYDHDIVDIESGRTVRVSSTHHQMFMPSDKAHVIAVSHHSSDREWYDGQVYKKDTSDMGYEVVYYKDTRCLCFQPHPEFYGYDGMRVYFEELMNKYILS